jgi:hypothetical protein
MRVPLLTLCVVFVLLVVVLSILLRLSTPLEWPFTPGSVKARKVTLDGQSFVFIEGEPANYLNQLQSIDVRCDSARKVILVTRCSLQWNPFTKCKVNNNWPILFSLQGLEPGEYSILYRTSNGDSSAASLNVP